MRERKYVWLLYLLAVTGLTFDLASKYGVFAWLAEKPTHTFALFRVGPAEGGFQLVAQFSEKPDGTRVPHVNHGALFGFLREHKTLANLGFAAISLIAAVAILIWSRFDSTAHDKWLCAALGLILGGTLGNLYDRLMFNGVRDFLHWNYLFDWPVFNIADCCLVAGAGLLLLQAFFVQPESEQQATTASEADAESGTVPLSSKMVQVP